MSIASYEDLHKWIFGGNQYQAYFLVNELKTTSYKPGKKPMSYQYNKASKIPDIN